MSFVGVVWNAGGPVATTREKPSSQEAEQVAQRMADLRNQMQTGESLGFNADAVPVEEE